MRHLKIVYRRFRQGFHAGTTPKPKRAAAELPIHLENFKLGNKYFGTQNNAKQNLLQLHSKNKYVNNPDLQRGRGILYGN